MYFIFVSDFFISSSPFSIIRWIGTRTCTYSVAVALSIHYNFGVATNLTHVAAAIDVAKDFGMILNMDKALCLRRLRQKRDPKCWCCPPQ